MLFLYSFIWFYSFNKTCYCFICNTLNTHCVWNVLYKYTYLPQMRSFVEIAECSGSLLCCMKIFSNLLCGGCWWWPWSAAVVLEAGRREICDRISAALDNPNHPVYNELWHFGKLSQPQAGSSKKVRWNTSGGLLSPQPERRVCKKSWIIFLLLPVDLLWKVNFHPIVIIFIWLFYLIIKLEASASQMKINWPCHCNMFTCSHSDGDLVCSWFYASYF